jgi:hypothetical protein
MALDSLLAKLKCGVSPVADVQASNGKASGCNGSDTLAVSGVSGFAPRLDAETADTARNDAAVSRKPAPAERCTADTPDTVERINIANIVEKVGAGETVTKANIWRAAAPETHDRVIDDRRYCTECRNLSQSSVCRIAKPQTGALVVARRGYCPSLDIRIRCEGFAELEGLNSE